MGDKNQNELAVFDAALELADTTERRAFLDQACGHDALFRSRMDKLIAAHENAKNFFKDCVPALGHASNLVSGDGAVPAIVSVEEQSGQFIERYKLLEKIGEGGCGVVYLAEQEKPVRRRVALKIIKLGMDTRNVIARFEAERQALALMEHPNIARVLDAGATVTGRPYFVMELVNGIKITEYCDGRGLDTRQRLDLFIQVCHAIQHAHQKGIIHRDIKPSNILVALHDGVPVPKVIDFGIAKATQERLTDKTFFTEHGNFIGTPAYMSPEQAAMNGLDVDTRSDIYSLGVLLYELLTGKTPFDQSDLLESGLDEMRRTLRETEPHRPSAKVNTLHGTELTSTAQNRHAEPPKLIWQLQGDLDWIVMKALEKDRKRRYETANGLALDIQRHLNHEPVLARPPSRSYRFQRLVQRNQVIFAAIGAVALTLVIGLGTSSWLFLKERGMEHEQSRLRLEAENREKIAKSALLISEGRNADANDLADKISWNQPTLDGAAVLRSLGEWFALEGEWNKAADRFQQLLQINQLNGWDTVSMDCLRYGAALAATGDQSRLDAFRREMVSRFDQETNLMVVTRVLEACLASPVGETKRKVLQSFTHEEISLPAVSVGGPSSSHNDVNRQSKLELVDIGTQQPCSMTNQDGLITIIAGGADIWNNVDGLAYASTLFAGDFDFRLRVRSIVPYLDAYTRVGLMARESLNRASSRHVMVAFNATNSFQLLMRSEEDTEANSVPQNPLPMAYGSNSWVRLQRVGAIFHAYTSSNGVDWAQLYQTTGGDKPFADPIYVGIAASAHSSNLVATFVISDIGPTPTIPVSVAITRALADYRRGDFPSAAKWCRRTLAYPECDAARITTAQIILAMACDRLQQPDEARLQFALAKDELTKKFANGLELGSPAGGFWFDWVFARVLLQEAFTQIIQAGTPANKSFLTNP